MSGIAEDAAGTAPRGTVWRIAPSRPSVAGQIAAVWRHRRLFLPLAVRAVFNIYRKAILGVAWMAAQPLAIALPVAFVLSNVFGISVDPLPMPLFILVGLAGWTLFRFGIQWMTKSLGSARGILRLVYAPPLLFVAAAIGPALCQFTIVMCVVAAAALYFGPVQDVYYVSLDWRAFAVLPAMLMSFLLALGIASFTSILQAYASDTWLTMRYLLSSIMLATPIIYPIEVIPAEFRWIVYLNPLTPIIELYRWALLGYGEIHGLYLGLAIVEILLLLTLGLWFFARQQTRLFDHL